MVEDLAKVFHKPDLGHHGIVQRLDFVAPENTYQREHQHSTGNKSDDVDPHGFWRPLVLVQVEQHHGKKKQHHDRAGIHDYMHHCQKLGVQQYIMAGNGEKGKREKKNRMDRLFRNKHHYR